MGIEFRCECGQVGAVPDAALHQYVKCPKCKQTSYVGSKTGPVVPVVHRPDRPRKSTRRRLARALVVTATILVVGGLAFGLLKNRETGGTISSPKEEKKTAKVDRTVIPDSDRVIVTRIQRELRADPQYRESFDRVKAKLIEEYRVIEEQRRAARLGTATDIAPGTQLVDIERRLRVREDEVHQLYVKWAAGVDHKVNRAVPEAAPSLVSLWVSKFFPEPDLAEVRASADE